MMNEKKTKPKFEFINRSPDVREGFCDTETKVTLDEGSEHLDAILYAFTNFLKASGFVIGISETLQLVDEFEEEDEETKERRMTWSVWPDEDEEEYGLGKSNTGGNGDEEGGNGDEEDDDEFEEEEAASV